MKIMFCHDGSQRAQKALEKTVDCFKLLKPEILLLCVVEDIVDMSSGDDRIAEKYKQERSEAMHKVAAWLADNGLEVHAILATGDPRRMIVEAVQKLSPDMVVIARKEKSMLADAFSKSISSYLAKNVGCHLMLSSF